MRWARAAALAAAALAVGALVWLVARRIAYPYDLEWLEGATLWHAQRLVDGQPIYTAPSLTFVPHPYTPLYPWLVAQLGRVLGVSYVVGRALSVAAFAGALVVGWRFCRRLGASAALATAALAIPCAAYVPTGAWIDLVRVDSVWLLLAAAGTTIAWPERGSAPATWRPVASALLLVAAFFTKQTAAPLMLAVALALVAVDRRRALVFVATLAAVGLPSLWLMQRATDGWFWFYVYRVHHSHPFSLTTASFVPGRLAMLLLPSLPLVAWALVRQARRDVDLGYAAWLAFVGVAVSTLAKGTWGAYTNALLPGVYLSALFIGVAASRLIDAPAAVDAPAVSDARRATIAWTLVAATIATAPGLVARLVQLVRPSTFHVHQANGYEPATELPAAEDREATRLLIARLRAVDGDVWLPSHAWYARLAGKVPLAGEMGADDLGLAGVSVRGFEDAVRARRFAAVVVDEPLNPRLAPLFARSTSTRLLGPARDDYNRRRPMWWLVPR